MAADGYQWSIWINPRTGEQFFEEKWRVIK